MPSPKKPQRVKKVKVEAIAVVGLNSNKIHSVEDGGAYAIFWDGDLAERRKFELKGRGLNVETIFVTISYQPPQSK